MISFKENLLSRSLEETIDIASDFIKSLNTLNINIFLNGNLGAGKTQFTKGIFKGLGYEKYMEVNSPTFDIVTSYSISDLTINHLDLYRIDVLNPEDEIWLDEIINKNGLNIIEWGNKFEFNTNKKNYFINIYLLENDERKIEILSN